MVFQTKYDYFKYQIMLFGLSNALVIFQGYFNKILVENFDIFVIIYLDNILIYIKDFGQPHVEVIYQVLDQLQKHFFFVNLKKCWFYQNKICFLRYVVLLKKISIKAKRIKVVKSQLKLKSVCNIQVFLGFANFYWQFIQSLNKIVAPLTLMLKTIR